MSASTADAASATMPDRLPFPPLAKSHIRNCAVPAWQTRYRTLTPKTRIVPLNAAFVAYLRSDGIVLPPDDDDDGFNGRGGAGRDAGDSDSEWGDGGDDDDDDDDDDDNGATAAKEQFAAWADVHARIKATIAELGGRVHPKLDWSAPKDATWMAGNTMECRSAGDIYLLLKSSNFVTHDLEEAYYGCEGADDLKPEDEIKYHLVLRKSVASMITSMEFRCFVRGRRLLAVCQRDLNHYEYMPSLVPLLQDLIYDFFNDKLKDTFPEENFVFDVYVPSPKEHGRVWLIDINPWAPRTDPLLFSWLELLTRPDPPEEPDLESLVVRMMIQPSDAATVVAAEEVTADNHPDSGYNTADVTEDETDAEEDEEDEEEDVEDLMPPYYPEFRIIKRDDPEAYGLNAPLYSAHKLPKDVVDASMTIDGQGGMREFLADWRQKVAEMEAGVGQDSSDDEES